MLCVCLVSVIFGRCDCCVDIVVNSVCWAPHEFGLILACGSSDGSISVLTYIGTFIYFWFFLSSNSHTTQR